MNNNRRYVIFGLIAVAFLGLLVAVKRPALVTDPKYLGSFLVLEIITFCVFRYAQLYFAFLMLSFLAAGTTTPLQSSAFTLRWVVLAVGAWVGLLFWLKNRSQHFAFFHLAAFLCVVVALASASVSNVPAVALLKAGSLALLFLYAASGMRLAFNARPADFVRRLVAACEILVYLSAIIYLIFHIPVYGNPNSLGVVMAFNATLLLWDAMSNQDNNLKYRHATAFVLAVVLLYISAARAAILGATVAACLLSFALRRRGLVTKIGFAVAMFTGLAGLANPPHFEEVVRNVTFNLIYKNHEQAGVFASRTGPWNATVNSIKKHPWFGSGYGTRSTLFDVPDAHLTRSVITGTEYANSYLSVVDYMGISGSLSFGLLLSLVLWRLGRIWMWIRKSGNANHHIVPVALIATVGLIHAVFEDWLIAPGSYTCIFFWSFIFVMMDFSPSAVPLEAASLAGVSRPKAGFSRSPIQPKVASPEASLG
jgi:O-antigen ligase